MPLEIVIFWNWKMLVQESVICSPGIKLDMHVVMHDWFLIIAYLNSLNKCDLID